MIRFHHYYSEKRGNGISIFVSVIPKGPCYENCTSNDSFMVSREVLLSHVYFALFAPLRTLGSAKGNKKKINHHSFYFPPN